MLSSNLGDTGGAPPVPRRDSVERRVEAEDVVAGLAAVTQEELLVTVSAPTRQTLDFVYRVWLRGEREQRNFVYRVWLRGREQRT